MYKRCANCKGHGYLKVKDRLAERAILQTKYGKILVKKGDYGWFFAYRLHTKERWCASRSINAVLVRAIQTWWKPNLKYGTKIIYTLDKKWHKPLGYKD